MNWIQSVVVGLFSGICEPLPISAEAHRGFLGLLLGLPAPQPLFLLSCHTAVLIVMLAAGRLELYRLWHTASLLRTSQRQRTGSPSLNQAGTLRLLTCAAVPVIVGRLLSYRFQAVFQRLWLLALPLTFSGLLLWLPTHIRTANKDGRHLSGADGLLMGLAALCAAIPGIPLVGAVLSVASIRGTQRQYAVRFTWLLLSLSLLTAVAADVLLIVRGGLSFSLPLLLSCGLGGAAAAFGSWLAVHLIRARTRSGADGISGFCFYNWGMALLCLMLFLLV